MENQSDNRRLMTPEEISKKIDELREEIRRVETRMNQKYKTKMSFYETAKYLEYSQSYLYKLTCQNKIPVHRPNGKILYFFKEEIDEWIRNGSG